MSIFENAREVAVASVAPTVSPAARQDGVDALRAVAQQHDLASRDLVWSLGATEKPAGAAGRDQKTTASDRIGAALDVLKKFIPGEAVALFVPGAAIFKAWGDPAAPALKAWFWVVLVLSVLFYLIAAATPAKPGDPVRLPFGVYFFWKLVALVIAYVVWVFGVSSETLAAFVSPGAKLDSHLSDVLGVLTLVTSPILTAFDGFFKNFTPQQKSVNS